MKRKYYLLPLFFSLFFSHFSQSQTLITDPDDGHYCADENGVSIILEDSEGGTTYFLIRVADQDTVSEIIGTGNDKAFPGLFASGTYKTDPETNEVSVFEDPVPNEIQVIAENGGEYCNYPNADGVIISIGPPSQNGVDYKLFRIPLVNPIDTWPGNGGAHDFGPFTTEGQYYVIAENSNTGCTTYLDTVEVSSNPVPTANFTANPQNQCASDPVQFTNLSIGNNLTYEWDFDDPASGGNNSSTDANPEHIFEAYGNDFKDFDVELIVTDINGCKDTSIQVITVKEKPDASLDENLNPQNPNYPNTFAYCGATLLDPNGYFEFSNISSTQGTNQSYNINWGDGTPDYNDLDFDVPVPHTYTTLGSKTLTFTVVGDNGCITVRQYGIFVGSTPEGGIGNPGNTYGFAPFTIDFPIQPETYNNTPGTRYIFDFGDGTKDTLFQESLPVDQILTHTYTTCSDLGIICPNGNNTQFAFIATCAATNPCSEANTSVCPINVSCPVQGGWGIGGWGGWGGGGYWGGNGLDTLVACNPVDFSDSTLSGVYINPFGNDTTSNTVYSWNFGDPLSGGNNTSNLPEPTHEFTNTNTWYVVTLIVYTGDGINNNSGIDTISKALFIQPPPIPDFEIDVTDACVPKMVQISNFSDIGLFGTPHYWWEVLNYPPGAYQIVTPGFEGDHTYHEPLFQFNVSGNPIIRMRVQNSCGEAFQELELLVCQPPEVSFAEDSVSMCGVGTMEFFPDYTINCDPDSVSYAWEVTGPGPINFIPATAQDSAFPVIEFNSVGFYDISVTITNPCGEDIAIQVLNATDLLDNNVITPENDEVCAGQFPININGTLPEGGNGVFDYQWEIYMLSDPDWDPIPGATDQDYTIPFALTETVWLRRRVLSGECEDLSNEIEITLLPAISNNLIFQDQQVCTGGFPAQITGTEPFGSSGVYDYQWYDSPDGVNWTLIPGANDIDFQPPQLFATTLFMREVSSDPCPENQSAPVVITICDPIEDNTISADQLICEGTQPNQLTGSLPTGACGNFSYQWQKSTDVIPVFSDIVGAINQNYQPGNINTITYFRRIVNSQICDSDTSNQVTINLLPAPNANAGPDQQITNGWQANLTGGNTNGGTPPYIFTWEPAGNFPAGGNIGEDVTTNPLASTTTFTLTVTDINGCVDTDEVTVFIEGDPLTVEILPAQLSRCPEDPEQQICASPSGGSNNYQYSWTSDPPGTNSNTQCISVAPVVTTTYFISVFDGSSTANSQILVTVFPYPVIQGSTDTAICSGSILNFTPQSTVPNTTFNWTSISGGTCEGNTNMNGGTIIEDLLVNTGNQDCQVVYQITPVGPGPNFCQGQTITYTVTVYPVMTGVPDPPSPQIIIAGTETQQVCFEPSGDEIEYEWTFVSADPPGQLNGYLNNGAGCIPPMTITNDGDESGTIVYEVVPTYNGCPGQPIQYVFTINSLPNIFTVTGGGSYCNYPDALGVPVGLSGSQPGIQYQLLLNGNPIDQQDGDMFPIDFGNQTQPGSYTVRGVNMITGLSTMMNGSAQVIISPLPQIYIVSASDDETCTPVTPLLSGSDLGINYMLLLNDDVIIETKQGSGLGEFLEFSPVLTPGVYKVKAVDLITSCERMMWDSIVVNPSPNQYSIIPGGIICEGQQLCLSGSQTSVKYQLWKDDDPFGDYYIGNGGIICFDEIPDGPGLYRVYALDTIASCDLFMDDSRMVNEKPWLYNMSPDTSCPGAEEIRIEGCQENIEYYLVFDGFDENVPESIEVAGPITCENTNDELTFGFFHDAGIYRVKAVSPQNCISWMPDSTLIFPAPVVQNLLPEGWGCDPKEIFLDGSEENVEYRLYKNGSWNPQISVQGNGGPISFGVIADEGLYTARGFYHHNENLECVSVMAGSYEITTSPIAYSLSPEEDIHCPCPEVTLSGSQPGVKYFLKNLSSGNVYPDPINGIPGTGNGISFGLICEPGDYISTGKNVLNPENCTTQMEGTFTISDSPEIFELLSVNFPAAYCFGDEGVTLKLSGSQNLVVEYTLFKDNNPDPDVPVSVIVGNGGEIVWENITAGTYYVEARYLNDPTCPAIMDNVIAVEEIPLPTAQLQLQPAICEGDCFNLIVNVTGEGPLNMVYRSDDPINGVFDFEIDNIQITPFTLATFCPQVTTTYSIVSIEMAGNPSCEGIDLGASIIVEVNPLPYVFAGDDGIICESGEYIIPNAFVENVSDFNWTVLSGAGEIINGDQINPTFIPEHEDAGSIVEIQLEAIGNLACINEIVYDTILIQVDSLPWVDAGNDGVICFSGEYQVTGVSMQNISEFEWQINVGAGSLDDPEIAEPTYTPGPGDAGTLVELVLEGAGDGACLNETHTDIVTIQIDSLPYVYAGADTAICENQVYLIQDAAVTNIDDLQWVIETGNGSITNSDQLEATYSPGLGDGGNTVALILEVTGSDACLGAIGLDTLLIEIDKLPTVEAGENGNICQNETYHLIGSVITDVSDFQWIILSGDGSLDDPTLAEPIYTPAPTDAGTLVEIELQGAGAQACLLETATDIVQIQVDSLPWVYAGDPGIICQSEAFTILNADTSNVTDFEWEVKDGLGSLSGELTLSPTYSPAQDDAGNIVELILNVTGSSACSLYIDADTLVIQIDSLPYVFAGDDGLICQNQTYTIPNSELIHTSTFNWQIISGNGSLNDPEILNPVYTPAEGDQGTQVIMSLEATGDAACNFEILSDQVMIQVDSVPQITSSEIISICSGQSLSYQITADVLNTGFVWNSINNTGGCVMGNSNSTTSIIDDILTNTCNEIKTITYEILPLGPEPASCVGDLFTLTVTVIPVANITNAQSEIFINSGETVNQLQFLPNIVNADVNYEWVGVESWDGLTGWDESNPGTTDFLPEMTISIEGENPPDECEIVYTITPYVSDCAGNDFQYTIHVYLLPTQYTLSGGGEFCDDGFTEVSIVLNSSQPNIEYQLVLNGNQFIEPPRDGTGNQLTWWVSEPGMYTVVAINPNTGVEIGMIGEIDVIGRELPLVYDLDFVAQGDNCLPVTPRLNNSEIGTKYQLLIENDPIGEPIVGTGEEILFGQQYLPGSYKVEAIIDYDLIFCSVFMNGELFADSIPQDINIIPNGEICENEDQICITNSELGIDYQLWSNNQLLGDAIQGNGDTICFGEMDDPGVYRIFASNPNTDCDVLFEQEIVVNATPVTFQISPNAGCPGTNIQLNNCQESVQYYLYFEAMQMDARPIERSLVQGPINCAGGGTIDFGEQWQVGEYRVLAVDSVSNCEAWMENTTTIYPTPLTFLVESEGDACPPRNILLEDCQEGVNYYLYYDDLSGNPQNPVHLETQTCNNGEVRFENYRMPGEYNVKAVWDHGAFVCESWMEGTVTINTQPDVFTLSPFEPQCPPVEFKLNGSQDDVTYKLYFQDGTLKGTEEGNGINVVKFDPVYEAGTYFVKAINQQACDTIMDSIGQVLPTPESFPMTPNPNGIYCFDDSITIGLQNSSVNVSYHLTLIGFANNPVTVAPGSDGPFMFDPPDVLQPGSYRVKAVDDNTGCWSWMPGELVIEHNPVVFGITANGIEVMDEADFCPPVEIGLSFSEDDVEYNLYCDQIPGSPIASIPGNQAAISFGDFSDAGRYIVMATNAATGCEKDMSGAINISNGPAQFSLICESPMFCVGSLDQVTITLEDTQSGVNYELLLNGNPINPAQIIPGNNGPVHWNEVSQYGEGIYSVVATFPNDPVCTAAMLNTVNVIELDLPSASINGDTTICFGDSVAIPVQLSGEYLDWELSYALNGVVQEPLQFPNNGDPAYIILWPEQDVTVELQELVYAVEPACDGTTNGIVNIFIDPQPEVFAGDSTSICLSGSYTIMDSDSAHLSDFIWELVQPAFGTLENTNTLNPTYIPDPEAGNNFVNIRLIGLGTGACSYQTDTSYMAVWVDSLPMAFAGADTVICANGLLQLDGFATNFGNPLWEDISGLGEFDNNEILNPFYQLTYPDSITEPDTALLVLTVGGINACSMESVSSTIVVEIIPLPQEVLAGKDTLICENLPSYLIADAYAEQYAEISWITEGDGTFDDSTVLNPQYFPGDADLTAGLVKLKIETLPLIPCVLSKSDSLLLSFQYLPLLENVNDTAICQNVDHIFLAPTGDFYDSIRWQASGDGYFEDSLMLQTTYWPGAEDVENGIVSMCLTAYASTPCEVQDSVQQCFDLTIQKLPDFAIGPDTVICEGTTYYFDESFAFADYYDSLQWTGGSGVFSDQNILNAIYTPGDEDINAGFAELCLTAYATGPCLPEDSVQHCVTLLIQKLPEIEMVADTVICQDQNLSLFDVIIADADSVVWIGGDGVFSDPAIANPVYTLGENDILNGSVELCVTAYSISPCLMGDSIQQCLSVGIQKLPEVFAGESITVCESQDSIMIADASAIDYSSLLWSTYPEGMGSFNDPQTLNPQYYIPEVNEPFNISLILSASGITPCEVSSVLDTLNLFVKPSPEIVVGDTLSVCVEDHVQIKDADTAYVSNFEWTVKTGMGNLDDPTRLDPTYYPAPEDGGTFVEVELMAIGKGVCNADTLYSSVVIEVSALPGITMNLTEGTLCVNDSDGFAVPNGAVIIDNYLTYEWEVDLETGGGDLLGSQTLEPIYLPHPYDAGKTIRLILKAEGLVDCEGHIAEDYFYIKVGAKPIVDFDPINNQSDSALCPQQPSYFEDFSYFYSGSNHEDQIITERIWTIDNQIVINTVETPYLEYTFSQPGIHEIELIVLTSIDGVESCYDSITKTIMVNVPPEPGFRFEKVSNCNGLVQFTDTSFSSQSYINDWWWTFDDDYYSDLPNPQYEYETSGQKLVTLTVTDNNGCVSTIDKTIEVEDFFDFDLIISGDCFGESMNFEVDPNSIKPVGNQIDQYEWTFGDGSPLSDEAIPEHTYSMPGNFELVLVATDDSDCVLVKDTIIRVPYPHNPLFTFNDCSNPVTFVGEAYYENEKYAYWYWDFGDGTEETLPATEDPIIEHEYAEHGIYAAKFAVIDTLGCTDTILIENIRTECLDFKGLYIPNAFAPEHSSDEVRVFKPKGIGMADYHIEVYDMWGNLLWESDELDDEGSPTESWDGTYKNALLPPGTYIYRAYAKFKDGTVWGGEVEEGTEYQDADNISGTILLIR